MKRPNNNGDNSADRSKRQVTATDRSFETVSTIESMSDHDDAPYVPNERFAITENDIDDHNNFFAHDDTLVMSFDEIHSNIVSQQDDSQHPRTSDPIATFTDEDIPGYQNGFYEEDDEIVTENSEVYSQNILDGLDDWKPTRGFPPSTEQPSLPLNDSDDDILSSFVTDDDELVASQQQQTSQQLHRKNTTAAIEGAPIPDFRIQSSSLPKVYPKVPPVATDNHNHHHHRNHRNQEPEYKSPEPLEFKDDGPARPIIKRISRAAEDHAAWEKKVRAQMAKLGSIPRVCSLFDNAILFRILDIWTERGLTFGRCVQVRSNELTLIMQNQQQKHEALTAGFNTHSNNNYHSDIDDDDDMIDDLVSQSTPLPPYTPMEGEEEFTFLFSFAYMPQVTPSMKNRFLQEECVAIWTPWTAVSDTQREICVVTRFLSYSLY